VGYVSIVFLFTGDVCFVGRDGLLVLVFDVDLCQLNRIWLQKIF